MSKAKQDQIVLGFLLVAGGMFLCLVCCVLLVIHLFLMLVGRKTPNPQGFRGLARAWWGVCFTGFVVCLLLCGLDQRFVVAFLAPLFPALMGLLASRTGNRLSSLPKASEQELQRSVQTVKLGVLGVVGATIVAYILGSW